MRAKTKLTDHWWASEDMPVRIVPGLAFLVDGRMTMLESQLRDPFNGLALLAKQAKRNLAAIRASQPLQGHLLPYIPFHQAQDYEITVHAVNGWLDTLSDPQLQSTSTENASTL